MNEINEKEVYKTEVTLCNYNRVQVHTRVIDSINEVEICSIYVYINAENLNRELDP